MGDTELRKEKHLLGLQMENTVGTTEQDLGGQRTWDTESQEGLEE